MRSKISFAVRQISLRVPFCTRRGWVVGVAALRGHIKSAWVDGGCISDICNSVIAINNRKRAEPFRGIATALRFLAMTYWENHYKKSISITSAEVSTLEVHKPITNG